METPKDLITGTDTGRICGVDPSRVVFWRKSGGGPPFYMVEAPGIRPRPMYSREEVEAFAKTRRRGAGRPRKPATLAARVEALEARLAERENGGRVEALETRLDKLERRGRIKVRRAKLAAAGV